MQNTSTNHTSEKLFAQYAEIIRSVGETPGSQPSILVTDIFNQLYSTIGYYVEYQLSNEYPTYYKDEILRDEMINSAWEEIVTSFHKYNGEYALTTFVKCYIRAGARKVISNKYGKAYLRTVNNKDTKEIYDMLNTDENINTIKLQNDNQVSSLRFKNIIAIKNYAVQSSLSGNIPIAEQSSDVEKFIQQNTESGLLKLLKEILSPLDYYILLLYSGVISGYNGYRYRIDMISFHPFIVECVEREHPERITYDMDWSRIYDEKSNKYIRIKSSEKHVIPSFISYRVQIIKKNKKKSCLL